MQEKQLSRIAINYYQKELHAMLRETASFLCESYYKLFEQNIEEFVWDGIRLEEDRSLPSIIDRSFLLKDYADYPEDIQIKVAGLAGRMIDEEIPHQVSKKEFYVIRFQQDQYEEKQADLRAVYEAFLERSKNRKATLKNIVEARSDVACALKIYNRYPDDYREQIRNWLDIDQKLFDETGRMASALITARGEWLGHEKVNPDEDVIGELKTSFDRTLPKYIQFISLINKNLNDKTLANLEARALKLQKVSEKQYTFEQVRAIAPLLTVQMLEVSKLNDRFDPDTSILYCVTEQELKETMAVFKTTMDEAVEALITKEATTENVQLTDGKHESMAISNMLETERDKRKSRDMLPELASLSGYDLSADNIDELIRETVFLTTPSAWMEDEEISYMTRYLLPRLKAAGKKMYIDFGSRAELYRLETGKDVDPDMKERGKRARTIISQLRRSGYISYLPTQNNIISIEDNIARIARDNPELRFTVLAQDDRMSDAAVSWQLDNVLPVMLMFGEPCIRLSTEPLILPFASEYVEYTRSDAEEETENPVPHQKDKTVVTENTTEKADRIPVLPAGSKIEYRLADGSELKCLDKIASGGEGTVYETSDPFAVAKIYHADTDMTVRRAKLAYMMDHDPQIDELCWPKGLIFDKDGQICGFLMPKVRDGFLPISHTIFKILGPAMKQKMWQWDRLSLAQLCLKIVTVLDMMIKEGINMGDVNPENILIDIDSADRPRITIVDCDSMQMDRYPCPVGVKAYTNPQIFIRLKNENPHFSDFLRTEEDLQYAIASLLFRILMCGGSPFAGKGDTTVEEAQRNYIFAYRTDKASGADTPDGPFRMIWNNTPKRIKDNFAKVFADGGFVDTREWINAFWEYSDNISNKFFTAELTPNRYRDYPGKDYNVNIICENCGKPSNMPKERHEIYRKIRMPLYCPMCNMELQRLRHIPAKTTRPCHICGQPVRVSEFDDLMIEWRVQGYRVECPECKKLRQERHEMTCMICGKPIPVDGVRYRRIKDGKEGAYCSEHRKVHIRCWQCGKPADVPRSRYEKLRNKNLALCDNCLKEKRNRR